MAPKKGSLLEMCPNFRVFLRERVFNCMRYVCNFPFPPILGTLLGTEESVFIRAVYMLISWVSLEREVQLYAV